MKTLIASDIHGSLPATRKIMERLGAMRPGQVLLLGDILYHGPRNALPVGYSPMEVAAALGAIDVPLMAVRGNCDAEIDELVLPFPLAECAWVLDCPHRLLALHGHKLPGGEGGLKAPAGTAILSGHTHLPVAEAQGPLHRWNPGSAAIPKGGFPPTFALYEDGLFQVLTFEGAVLKEDRL